MTEPLISIVLPSSGKYKNLSRCLQSLVNNAPEGLLAGAELVVFLNEDPSSPIDYVRIEDYLNRIKDVFGSFKLVRSSRFELTAEQSAYAASEHATGKFIWLVGDKRIFLPEGLQALSGWLSNPTSPAAYFNSVWVSSHGLTNNYVSTHFVSPNPVLPYKQFVMRNGVNYMATNMGAWVFERRCLDRDVWGQIISNCGPHFSHVATTLAVLTNEPLQCFSAFLCQMESKAYHTGDDTEWVRYSKLSKTYRYYAWTLGLVRQFNFLIDRGVYTTDDVRRSMCSEGILLKRQVDEIYTHVAAQLRNGWFDRSQRMSSSEFSEIYNFLCRCCPEKIITNDLLLDIFDGYDKLSDKEFSRIISIAYDSFGVDVSATRLGSLIVGQVGDKFIRLHPAGYIISAVTDNEDFVLAYKLVEAPKDAKAWSIVSSLDAPLFPANINRIKFGDIIPKTNSSPKGSNFVRDLTRKWVVMFYRRRLAYHVVAMLPPKAKRALRALLM